MDSFASFIADTGKSWLKWRFLKRQTIGGWALVFIAQAIVGALLFLGVMHLLGAPLSLPVIYAAVFFSIGCGLSGVVFSLLWATLFLQIIGAITGATLGVWFGLPSWWSAAAAEWTNGTVIPKSVIAVGLLIPPLWCASCVLLHKAWFKGWNMAFDKIISFFSSEGKKDARRKQAAKDLEASDKEVFSAMNEPTYEVEGLSVISKSQIQKEPESIEVDEEEEGDVYEELSVGGGMDELSGLSDAAQKSRQKVDENGAVIADDSKPSDANSSVDSLPSSVPSQKEVAKTEDPVTSAHVEDNSPKKSDQLVSSESRAVIDYLVGTYDTEMASSADENATFLSFMERHKDRLLSLSDIEIAYMRNLGGIGKSVAVLALELQGRNPSVETSFDDAVSKGLEEINESNISRPTSEVTEEVVADPVRDQISDDLEDEVEDEVERETFDADFSFSGDEASNAHTGSRIASLLSKAASIEIENINSGRKTSEVEFDYDDSEDVVTPENEVGLASDDKDEASSMTGDDISDQSKHVQIEGFNAVKRRIDLMASGMSAEDSASQVEREMEELSKAQEVESVSESASSENEETAETFVPSEEGKSTSSSESQEVVSEEAMEELPVDEKLADNPPSEEVSVAEVSSANEEGVTEEEFGGFGLPVEEDSSSDKAATDGDPDVGSEILPEISKESQDEEALDDAESDVTSVSQTEDPIESESSEAEIDPEVVNRSIDGTADYPRNGENMGIEAAVTKYQAVKVYSILVRDDLDRREKFSQLMELERTPEFLDTISVVRSSVFIQENGEKAAHDLRNMAISLIRDFKDDEIVLFGSEASELEAKIIEFEKAPYKLSRDILDEMFAKVDVLGGYLKKDTPSKHSTERKLRLAQISSGVKALNEEFIASTEKPKKPVATPVSAEQKKVASIMVGSLSGDGESEVFLPDEDDDQDGDEEIDLEAAANESESDNMPAVEAVNSEEKPEFERPWEDPTLGDLDADLSLIPEGVDVSLPESASAIRERAELIERREEAKKLRAKFLEEERQAQKKVEEEEREIRVKNEQEEEELAQQNARIANLTQREEALKEMEENLQERSRNLELERNEIEEKRSKIAEETKQFEGRVKVLDDLSGVLGDDVSKKVETVQFVHQNMKGLFEVREVPVRFAQVSSMFMDLALSKVIQKRVKGASVSMQQIFGRENGEDLPERLFPHKSIVTFHGATIFRKASEILQRLAIEFEVEIKIPQSEMEDADISQLIECCENSDEKDFLEEVIAHMRSAKSEFFQLHQAVEENANDFKQARHAESFEAQDAEVLKKANAEMVQTVDELRDKLAAAEKKLQDAMAAGPSDMSSFSANEDNPELVDEALNYFKEKGFSKNMLQISFEVGGKRVIVGSFEEAGKDRFTVEQIVENMSKYKNEAFVIFTNTPIVDDHVFSMTSTNSMFSVEKLTIENIDKFIEEQIKGYE